jgi:glc operon protein GlcG
MLTSFLLVAAWVGRAKAWGALGMGISSRGIRDRISDRPIFLASLTTISGGSVAPAPGGVLILNGTSEVLGAVGVSGDASDRDEVSKRQPARWRACL